MVDAKDREDSVGYNNGKVRTDIAQGAFTRQINFKVPPGRNGLAPDLTLLYNSQDLNDSPYGYGWQLSIPTIERMNQIGTDRLYIDNFFTSSLGGELVPMDNNGNYGHRFEDGRFVRYEFQNNVWTAYDKSGTRYSFGTTTASRQSATTSPDNVYRWMLEEVRDTNDNYVKFEYTKDGNQIYPSKITYTGHGTTDGPFEIDFTYATRPDIYTSYKTGFLIYTTKRLTQVEVSVDGDWRRKYTLSYGSGSNGLRSVLTSVQETGRDEDSNETSLPANAFSYSSSTISYASSTNPRVWNSARMVADIDGNGLPDKAVFWSNSGTSSAHRIVDENEYPAFPQYNQAVSSEFWSYDNSGLGGANDFPYVERGVRMLDLNSDGRADIVRNYRDSSGVPTLAYYESTAPFTWVSTSTPSRLPLFGCASGGESYSTGLFGNINGDWLVDYVATTTACAIVSGTYLNSGLENGWRIKNSFAPIATMATTSTAVEVSQLIDINGDGLDDWMYSTASTTSFHINTGSSWGSADSRWTINTGLRQSGGWDKGIRFMDMNGDGLADYVRAYSMSPYSSKASGVTDVETGTYNYVYINTGSGFATSTLQVPEYIFNGVVSSSQWTGRVNYNEMVDWNGDGLLDSAGAISTVSSGNTARPDVLTYVGYTTGGVSRVEYKFSSQMANQNPGLPFPVLVVTKITDEDSFGGSEVTTYSYEGGKIYFDPTNIRNRRFAGFAKVNRYDTLGTTQSYYHQGDTASTTVGELTDGFALIGKKYREDVLNTASSTLKKSFYGWSNDEFATSATTSTSTIDIARGSSVFSNTINTNSYSFDVTVGTSDNMLVVIGDKQGSFLGGVTYNSIPLTSYGPGVSADSNRNMNFWYLVNPPTGTHTLNITGSTYAWIGAHAISYSGVDTENPFGLYDAVGSITSTSSITASVVTDTPRAWLVGAFGSTDGATHSVNLGSFVTVSDTESWDSGTSTGSTGIKQVTYSSTGSGTMAKLVVSMNPVLPIQSPAPTYWYTKLAYESTQDFDGGSSHKDRAVEYTYATSTGNLLTQVERGEVTGSSDGSYTDIGSDTRTTVFTYSATTTRNLTLPTSKEIKNNSGTSVALTNYYYDSQSLGTALKGSLIKEEKWISGSDYSSTTKAYNSYGLVTSEKDPRSNTTTYTYDSFNLYPETVTNALSQDTEYLYDYMVGKPKEVQDDNGTVRKTVFDPLGRVKEEKQTNPSFPLLTVVSKEYTYTDTFPTSVRVRTYLDSASTTDSYTYRDGLGRVIQERSQAEVSNRFSVKSYIYNSAGLLQRESIPYFATSSARTGAPEITSLYTSYTHDALRRPLTIANAVGTTTYTYYPWRVKVTDAEDTPKDIYKDAYGNPLYVVENNSGEVATTTYTHDSLNNLTGITDSLSNIRSFTYDGLSRRTLAQDLHASADSTYGIWNYAYDVAGNLASTTDPKGQTVHSSFDALNRKVTEDYTGSAGTETTYTYDSCDYGVGRICIASSTAARTEYDYDILGNIASEEKKIANKTYTTSYTYDRRGTVLSATLPNSTTVNYVYNDSGAIESATHASNPIFTDLNYGPHGKLTAKKFANGVETHYAYDSFALYRLTNILTTYTSGIAFNESSSSRFALSDLFKTTRALFIPEVYAEEIESTEEAPLPEVVEEVPVAEENTGVIEPVEVEVEATVGEPVSVPVEEPVVTENVIEDPVEPAIVVPEVATTSIEQIVPVLEVATSTASTTESTAKIPKAEEDGVMRFISPITPGTIRAALEGKGSYKRANIKGEEIAKVTGGIKEKRENYTIEIVSIESIEGGVQAFVRAWDKNGDQIGFGPKGDVDMERFRIYNPPVLVPDERGDIRQEWTRKDAETGQPKVYTRTLREDPREALLQVIEHNLSVMKNVHDSEKIVKGKKGNTVSTFYPAAGQATPVDGQTGWNGSAQWSDAHPDTAVYSCDACVGGEVGIRMNNTSVENLYRNIFGFDTSVIGSNIPSSATLSVTMHTGATGGTSPGDFKVVVDKHNGPASSAAITTSDHGLANWVSVMQSNTEVAINSVTSRQYYNFTLNSTGLNNINHTGNTWLGLRIGYDLSNTSPGNRSHMSYNAETIFADTTGTTEDPKLVVEHNATPPITDPFPTASGTRLQDLFYSYDKVGNITSIVEAATTTLARKVNYTYDDLSRLLSASTTATSSTSYKEVYEYNKIGNLTKKGASYTSGVSAKSSDLEKDNSQYWSISDGSQTGLDNLSNFTISGWFNLETLPASGDTYNLVSKGILYLNSNKSYSVYLYNDSGTYYLRFYVFGDADRDYWTVTSYQVTPSASTWYNFVATFKGDESAVSDKMHVYLNGTELSKYYSGYNGVSATYAINSTGEINIGKSEWDTNIYRYVDGLVDDVRVWSRVLSGSEVTNLYTDPNNFSNGSGLKGWWKFDDNGQDSSGNANHLTNNNSITYSATIPSNMTPPTSLTAYTYSGSGYLNPHAPSVYFDGSATTTYSYDNNGNVISAIFGAATSTYTWDYMNRLVSATTTGTTSLYAYDHTTARVSETVDGRYFHYPSKFYSAEYTDSSFQNGTSTSYIWAGDTLIAYVERPIVSGSPSGTAKTYYVHQDHLESTNVVTDSTGSVVTFKDYLPYGSTRTESGPGELGRGYIAQFENEGNDLSYLNARYYEGSRGQFLSQDPVFWEIGQTQDGKNVLNVPQAQNSYAYGGGNPITNKDPLGRDYLEVSGNVNFFTFSGSVGLAIDFRNLRMDLLYGGGVSGGAGADLSVVYYPKSDLPDQDRYTMASADFSAAYYAGIKTSVNRCTDCKDKDLRADVGVGGGLGLGLSGSLGAMRAIRVIDYTKPTSVVSKVPKSNSRTGTESTVGSSSRTDYNISNDLRGLMNALRPFMTSDAQKRLKSAGF